MTALSIAKEIVKLENSHLPKIRFNSGHIICNSESFCNQLLIVENGNLRVYKSSPDGRACTLYQVSSGECCCLTISSILNNTKFPAIIEAENDVLAYKVSANQVRKWLREHKNWQKYIFKLLTQKVTQLANLADNLVFNNMDSRISNLLCRRQKEKRVVYATHQSIANEVGTSREVVSRSLKLLELKGYIKLKRGQVEIIDFNALNSKD